MAKTLVPAASQASASTDWRSEVDAHWSHREVKSTDPVQTDKQGYQKLENVSEKCCHARMSDWTKDLDHWLGPAAVDPIAKAFQQSPARFRKY